MKFVAKAIRSTSIVNGGFLLIDTTGKAAAQCMIMVPNPSLPRAEITTEIVRQALIRWPMPQQGIRPNTEGFWWGKWKIKAEGTADPDDPPGGEWEVMHVVSNSLDPKDLAVMVPGVAKWQPVDYFFWGSRVLRD